MKFRALFFAVLTPISLFMASQAKAIECKDADLLSAKLITDICWDCIFPIKVAGATLAEGNGQTPGAPLTGPPICVCDDAFGLPTRIGVVTEYFEPARVVESQLVPGCMSGLGGITLPANRGRLGGSASTAAGSSSDTRDISFHHQRYYAFPLLSMMGLFSGAGCNSDGMVDFDLLTITELDPTWNNEVLASFSFPETAAVANPLGVASCAVDAAAANAGAPLNDMFWCSGSQGQIYPISGLATGPQGSQQASSLLTTRLLTQLHRRGFARRTYGNDAMCQSQIDTFLPKEQYRLTQFAPRPETSRGRVIGESTLKWGSFKKYPGGTSPVTVVWRWNQCCLN